MFLAHPFRVDGDRRTATVRERQHVYELITQVLFTSPGERVNRPDLGSGVLQLVHSSGLEIAAATEMLVTSSLQQWLGHLIAIEDVEVTQGVGVLSVRVVYRYPLNSSQPSEYERSIEVRR